MNNFQALSQKRIAKSFPFERKPSFPRVFEQKTDDMLFIPAEDLHLTGPALSFFDQVDSYSDTLATKFEARNFEPELPEESMDIESLNQKNYESKIKKVLYMELDENSGVRNTFQEEALRYIGLHNFCFLPSRAISQRSNFNILKAIEEETKQILKPQNNFFQIGSAALTGINQIGVCDPSMSQSHAKIIYNNPFQPYFTFLLCQNKACFEVTGKKSLLTKLPGEIHRLIVDFVGVTNSFFIEAGENPQGTFELISEAHPQKISHDQEYQLSVDASIRFLEANGQGNMMNACNGSLFLKAIKKFMKYDGVIVLGLSCAKTAQLTAELPDFDKDESLETSDLEWEGNFSLPIPYLKLEIRAEGKKCSKYLLLPINQDEFTIGRNYDVDIKLASVLCSRKHCEIKYNVKTGFWTIADGSKGNPSLAGTWSSLQTFKERKEKRKSKQVPITDGSRFKLGESIFRFSYKKIKYA